MKQRKLRINLIDILIILLIVAAIIFVVSYFVSNNKSNDNTVEKTTIQYVVEFQNIDEIFANSISVGDHVQYDVKKVGFGTVVGIQSIPYEVITYDYENEAEFVSIVDGKLLISVTIEAEAVETDAAFTVNGSDVRVGQAYTLNFPNFVGTGYCVRINEEN